MLSFAAIAAALIAIPGPDWAYVLGAGARDHVVGPAAAGVVAGYALITAVVVVGVGPLVATVPPALFVLTVAGSTYLIYLGVRTLRSPATAPPAVRRSPGPQAGPSAAGWASAD